MAKKASGTEGGSTRRTAGGRSRPVGRGSSGASRGRPAPVDLGRALVEAYLTNERINQVLLDLLDPAVWRAPPPCSRRRNIATTFAHLHNVRCMRLKMCGKGTRVPARLDRGEVTVTQAKKALTESAAAMADLIERSVAAGGRAPNHRPDVVALVCGAITHDAHHRGQICHWTAQLGSPITPEGALAMWEWDKRWKEVAGG